MASWRLLPRFSVGSLLAVTLAVLVPPLAAEDWPQWLGPRGDSVWRDAGIVRTLPAAGLPVRWRREIGGGYSAPAVARGRVYLLDRRDRTEAKPANQALERTRTEGSERVLCLAEDDGRVLWQYEYPCPYAIAYATGPRAMPTVADGAVYTLGAEGHLHCLEAETGRVRWARDFPREFGVKTQLWGFSAAPVVIDDLVICLVGGAGQTAVAFDRATGAERWRALNAAEPGYATPARWSVQGRTQLVVWDPEAISGLDPATGRVFWSVPFKTKMGHSVITPRIADGHLFASAFFDGALLLQLDATTATAREVWRRKGPTEQKTQALHCLMSPPWIEDGHIYGVCAYGQLRCLQLATGERNWETLAATTANGKPARWATAFMVKHEDRFFLLNERGELILARLSPAGYAEDSRVHLLAPTTKAGAREVLWSHPAFANGTVFARNDREIVAADLRQR